METGKAVTVVTVTPCPNSAIAETDQPLASRDREGACIVGSRGCKAWRQSSPAKGQGPGSHTHLHISAQPYPLTCFQGSRLLSLMGTAPTPELWLAYPGVRLQQRGMQKAMSPKPCQTSLPQEHSQGLCAHHSTGILTPKPPP